MVWRKSEMKIQPEVDEYRYTPLDPSQHSVRLLTVIQCALATATFQESPLQEGSGTGPTWETSSYHWGDASDRLPIRLHGKHFTITKNLGCALRQRRLKDRPGGLWADAMCMIRQTVEKSAIRCSTGLPSIMMPQEF